MLDANNHLGMLWSNRGDYAKAEAFLLEVPGPPPIRVHPGHPAPSNSIRVHASPSEPG